MSFHEDMAKFTRHMKLLEREYEQWFSGALARPPMDTKRVCESIIKHYSRNMPRSLSEQSIFQMHQAKFNTYTEMWNRRMRLKEEGKLVTGKEERSKRVAAVAPPPNKEGKADPFRKVFDKYVEAREKTGLSAANLDYDKFKKTLQKQALQIRDKGGYKNINFGISVKDGKVSVVARPKK